MNSERASHRPLHRLRCTMSWNKIQKPGTYVALNGETLYRIQEESFDKDHSPTITTISAMNGLDGISVAKLSDDPNVTLTQARQLCADSDIQPEF